MTSNSSGVSAPVFQDAVFNSDFAYVMQLGGDTQGLYVVRLHAISVAIRTE